MADKSAIEWTDATWNPIVGCSIDTTGCIHCYAMRMAGRIEAMGSAVHYAGTTRKVNGNTVWTGKLALAPEHILTQPLRWARPRRIFVNSMGDLFHEGVPDEWIDKVFAVMALSPQHTFQVLTKRARRMREYVRRLPNRDDLVADQAVTMTHGDHRRHVMFAVRNPLPNVWLGVSAERQQEADARIPELLATPAAIRFVSAEPLLGPIDFGAIKRFPDIGKEFIHSLAGRMWSDQSGLPNPDPAWAFPGQRFCDGDRGLDWIIAGGESGPDARPMHPDWPRAIRDQCAGAGVPFFFKQWGEWNTRGHAFGTGAVKQPHAEIDGRSIAAPWGREDVIMARVGKKAAGRLLDGIEHNGMPDMREVPAL